MLLPHLTKLAAVLAIVWYLLQNQFPDWFGYDTKSAENKRKIDKWDYIKLKTFLHPRHIVKTYCSRAVISLRTSAMPYSYLDSPEYFPQVPQNRTLLNIWWLNKWINLNKWDLLFSVLVDSNCSEWPKTSSVNFENKFLTYFIRYSLFQFSERIMCYILEGNKIALSVVWIERWKLIRILFTT